MASGYIFWMTWGVWGVWGPSFKRKKLVILSLFGVFFHCLEMLSWAIGGLLLTTLSLGCYLLLSTMLGTIFRILVIVLIDTDDIMGTVNTASIFYSYFFSLFLPYFMVECGY
jgi:hypothetical protein